MSVQLTIPIAKQDYYAFNFLDGDKKGENGVLSGMLFINCARTQIYINISTLKGYITGSNTPLYCYDALNRIYFVDFLMVWLAFSTNFSDIGTPPPTKSEYSIYIDYARFSTSTTSTSAEIPIHLGNATGVDSS